MLLYWLQISPHILHRCYTLKGCHIALVHIYYKERSISTCSDWVHTMIYMYAWHATPWSKTSCQPHIWRSNTVRSHVHLKKVLMVVWKLQLNSYCWCNKMSCEIFLQQNQPFHLDSLFLNYTKLVPLMKNVKHYVI